MDWVSILAMMVAAVNGRQTHCRRSALVPMAMTSRSSRRKQVMICRDRTNMAKPTAARKITATFRQKKKLSRTL